jgi:hypothetical protein
MCFSLPELVALTIVITNGVPISNSSLEVFFFSISVSYELRQAALSAQLLTMSQLVSHATLRCNNCDVATCFAMTTVPFFWASTIGTAFDLCAC